MVDYYRQEFLKLSDANVDRVWKQFRDDGNKEELSDAQMRTFTRWLDVSNAIGLCQTYATNSEIEGVLAAWTDKLEVLDLGSGQFANEGRKGLRRLGLEEMTKGSNSTELFFLSKEEKAYFCSASLTSLSQIIAEMR